MAQLEILFDVVSPYTYLAAYRLANEPKFSSVQITWTPILLGGLFKSTGNRPPAEVAPKGAYMFKDLQRLADYYGVPYAFSPHFPINSIMPMRGATALKQQNSPHFLPYVMRMFKGFWVEKLNISDPEVWAKLVGEIGLDAAALRAATETPEVKEGLKSATERAVDLGAFGVPALIVDGELYWGVDRMFLVEKALGVESVGR